MMPVPRERLEAILEDKDHEAAAAACGEHRYVEGWRIMDDGVLVIYDCDDPPDWLAQVIHSEALLEARANAEPDPPCPKCRGLNVIASGPDAGKPCPVCAAPPGPPSPPRPQHHRPVG